MDSSVDLCGYRRIGLLLSLIANLAACIYLALRGQTQPYRTFSTSAICVGRMGLPGAVRLGIQYRWMPVFLGLKPVRPKLLLGALVVNFAGVVLTLVGWGLKRLPSLW